MSTILKLIYQTQWALEAMEINKHKEGLYKNKTLTSCKCKLKTINSLKILEKYQKKNKLLNKIIDNKYNKMIIRW